VKETEKEKEEEERERKGEKKTERERERDEVIDLKHCGEVGYCFVPKEREREKYKDEKKESEEKDEIKERKKEREREMNIGDSLILRCPIGVISYRDGIYCCDGEREREGKVSVTKFTLLEERERDDTSLVRCEPVTGRTHQIRLHLQLLGSPIANDPCYGGTLFYDQKERRTQAHLLMREMRETGKHFLSRIPHLEREREREEEGEGEGEREREDQNMTGDGEREEEKEKEREREREREEDLKRREGEDDDEYLIRTCRYCKTSLSTRHVEHTLHCDGIWLHALQYTGTDWSFETPLPHWA